MAKIVSLTNIHSQKRRALERKLADTNNELTALAEKEKALCTQRDSLERQLYTSSERANIAIQRKAKKLDW